MDLSLNLNCILAQRLVKTESGGRVPAIEVLVNTPYISKLIRDGGDDPNLAHINLQTEILVKRRQALLRSNLLRDNQDEGGE